ncbi:MAG: transposase, partial [Bryobacteraceae bacterium]
KQYRTRPQLALEMIQIVARWLGPRKLRVLGDSEYAGGSISRHLPANTQLISRMTMNAALYELPPRQTIGRGHRRKKGARLSNPLQRSPWPPPRRLLLLHRPHAEAFTDTRNLCSALAIRGLDASRVPASSSRARTDACIDC